MEVFLVSDIPLEFLHLDSHLTLNVLACFFHNSLIEEFYPQTP